MGTGRIGWPKVSCVFLAFRLPIGAPTDTECALYANWLVRKMKKVFGNIFTWRNIFVSWRRHVGISTSKRTEKRAW